jgi:hypothetical protein
MFERLGGTGVKASDRCEGYMLQDAGAWLAERRLPTRSSFDDYYKQIQGRETFRSDTLSAGSTQWC